MPTCWVNLPLKVLSAEESGTEATAVCLSSELPQVMGVTSSGVFHLHNKPLLLLETALPSSKIQEKKM